MVKENKENVENNIQTKIKFSDLSLSIKIPIIVSWIGISIYGILFLIGFLSMFIGG